MRQKLGQHFLVNVEMPDVIADALTIAAGNTIVEVGPGHGELTQAIINTIEAKKIKDVKVVAIERDPALAEGTRQRFKEISYFKIIEADILEFLENSKFNSERRQILDGGYKMVGNLPYYLTGHLLRIISELEHKPALSIFMVQKEVADRMASKPPQMNRLAAAVQFWAEPKILFYVSKDEFDPPPEVDSAVIILSLCRDNKAEKNAGIFYRTIQNLFAQPRKTVFNNLRKAFSAGKLSEEESLQILKDVDIDPKARPQDLSLEKISNLADKMGGL